MSQPFRVLGIGFEPAFAEYLLEPVAARTGIAFTYALVGDARRLETVRRGHPARRWVSISKRVGEPLPAPDLALLGSLEGPGVPTVRSMIQGDRVLRDRPGEDALGYLTLLAQRIDAAVAELDPDLILGTFDNAHSAIGMAVARNRKIPWVAMAFTVIPAHRMGFCKTMMPDSLIPLRWPAGGLVRAEAQSVLELFRSNRVVVPAYRPPATARQRFAQALTYMGNSVRRVTRRNELGADEFTYPSLMERGADVIRRTINAWRLPADRLILAPPSAPYVFFPLHMAPESSVDTWAPMYQNQLETAFQLALAVPADMELVVKLHFSDPDNYSRAQLSRLLQLPRVRIAHPRAPGRDFLDRATLVAGIQGTACIEGALLGKPVLLYGDSPYQHFPRSERARRPDEVADQIRRMVSAAPPSDEKIVDAFATYIARYMPSRHNDWNGPIDDVEAERMADCFRALRDHVATPGVRAGWYDGSPFASVA
jgi:hypothetical protein